MDALMEFLNAVLQLIPPVVPAAVLIALLVDLGKRIPVRGGTLIPDGKAGLASLILNAAFWLALYAAGELGIRAEAEAMLIQIGELAPVIMALLVGLYLSPKVHDFAVARGFGFSYPKARAVAR